MRDDPDDDQPPSRKAIPIPAMLVIAPGLPEERSTPVYDWVVVGRECPGVDERHRLLIDDATISRAHLELWLDLEGDEAWLTDRSTNGTRVNGHRIARSMPTRIRPGDRVRLGGVELQFRSRRFTSMSRNASLETVRQVAVADMVMAVGDIVSFSSIAEYTDDRVLLENIDRLYAELRQILARHHGTLSNYVGDAFFATWETADDPDSARAAVAFAMEAAETVPRIAADLDLRDPAGGPLHMGWGVSAGRAAVSLLTGMLVSVLGDTTNVAFRLSGVAGRDGRPDVLVTDAVYRQTAASFAFTPPQVYRLKGRSQTVEALGASRL